MYQCGHPSLNTYNLKRVQLKTHRYSFNQLIYAFQHYSYNSLILTLNLDLTLTLIWA